MNYDLAKKLKDAGFPQVFHYKTAHEQDGYLDEDVNAKDHKVAIPTLSELIEACGKDFGNLALKNWNPEGNNQWIAEPNYYISMDIAEGAGFTPEEAVGRLWLLLNTVKHPN